MNKYLLSIGLLSISLICRADFNDGLTAFNAGDYPKALKEWKAVVEQKPTLSTDLEWHPSNPKDIADAQYGLGVLYWQGKGVAQNYHEAKKWLELAANSGHSMAQLKLAYLYLKGLEGQANTTEAVKWFEKSAQQGNANAQYILGLVYLNGEGGISANQELAKKWLTSAAQQGESAAKTLLAKINTASVQTSVKQNPPAPVVQQVAPIVPTQPVVKTQLPEPSPEPAVVAATTKTTAKEVAKPLAATTEHYAIQLLASANQSDATRFIKNWQDQLHPLVTTHKTKNHQQIFVVVYGNYASLSDAKQAMAGLPAELRKNKPWTVKMHGGSLIP